MSKLNGKYKATSREGREPQAPPKPLSGQDVVQATVWSWCLVCCNREGLALKGWYLGLFISVLTLEPQCCHLHCIRALKTNCPSFLFPIQTPALAQKSRVASFS